MSLAGVEIDVVGGAIDVVDGGVRRYGHRTRQMSRPRLMLPAVLLALMDDCTREIEVESVWKSFF